MRTQFGLLTLLAIVNLTALFSLCLWNVEAGHREPGRASPEEIECLGVRLVPGTPLIVSSTLFGFPFICRELVHPWPPYKGRSANIIDGWGTAGNVLISLALSCGVVFSLRRLWRWWRPRKGLTS